jgi:hypothetical protein
MSNDAHVPEGAVSAFFAAARVASGRTLIIAASPHAPLFQTRHPARALRRSTIRMKKLGIIAAVVAALIGALIWYANQPGAWTQRRCAACARRRWRRYEPH